MYELPHKLPNGLKHTILGNWKLQGKSKIEQRHELNEA